MSPTRHIFRSNDWLASRVSPQEDIFTVADDTYRSTSESSKLRLLICDISPILCRTLSHLPLKWCLRRQVNQCLGCCWEPGFPNSLSFECHSTTYANYTMSIGQYECRRERSKLSFHSPSVPSIQDKFFLGISKRNPFHAGCPKDQCHQHGRILLCDPDATSQLRWMQRLKLIYLKVEATLDIPCSVFPYLIIETPREGRHTDLDHATAATYP